MFDQMVWNEDRLFLGDLVFRMEDLRDDSHTRIEKEYFLLYKSEPLIGQYRVLFSKLDLRPRNVFELGLWDGGSTAFWFETLKPDKHVGVDMSERGDSAYFRRWVESRDLHDRVATYWGVDQADKHSIREIALREFDGPLDLVIDDASHFYAPTKASFETLFPLLRHGGVYIFEDWQWEHLPEFQGPDHPWFEKEGLTRLVFELVEATPTGGLIGTLMLSEGFVAVERGWGTTGDDGDFRLDTYILRRPPKT
jgi:hypothetical protein